MRYPRLAGIFGSVVAIAASLVFTATAHAAVAPVQLGTAATFGVLAGSTITNTGNTVINGDLGLHPGTAVTGFPPGIVNGAMHVTDAVALRAKTDLVTAYNDAAGRPATATTAADLGGLVLVSGVYRTGATPSVGLTGNLTLDAQGDPNAVFIFQIQSTLTTATDSSVSLINGAQSCNVFWQVGSSATLGTRTAFRGNIMALESISVNDAATIDGRLLARNGALTQINDTITRATCAAGTTGGTGGTGGDDGTGGTGGGGAGTDRTAPVVFISGVPRVTSTPAADCTTRDFVARVALRDGAGIRRAYVFLDGVRIRTTTLTRFALAVRIRGLTIGRHRLTVVAFDRNGNRARSTRVFARCAVAVTAPRFTG